MPENLPAEIQQAIKPFRPPRKLNRRKALELANQGLSTQDIARHQGVNQTTVWKFLKHYNLNKQALGEYKAHRSDIFAASQCTALEVLDKVFHSFIKLPPKTIESMPWSAKNGLAHAANNHLGITYDKERLEQGLSTSNIMYADMVKARETLAKERQELESDPTGSGTE